MIDIILDYLVVIICLMGFSAAAAYLSNSRAFSINIFLVSVAIGIAILIWIPILPVYFIVVSVLILAGMLFMEDNSAV